MGLAYCRAQTSILSLRLQDSVCRFTQLTQFLHEVSDPGFKLASDSAKRAVPQRDTYFPIAGPATECCAHQIDSNANATVGTAGGTAGGGRNDLLLP